MSSIKIGLNDPSPDKKSNKTHFYIGIALLVGFFVLLVVLVVLSSKKDNPEEVNPEEVNPEEVDPEEVDPEENILTNWVGRKYSTIVDSGGRRCGLEFNKTACPDNQCCSSQGYCGGFTGGHDPWCNTSMLGGHFNDKKPPLDLTTNNASIPTSSSTSSSASSSAPALVPPQ